MLAAEERKDGEWGERGLGACNGSGGEEGGKLVPFGRGSKYYISNHLPSAAVESAWALVALALAGLAGSR
jgi:hypothetical protein